MNTNGNVALPTRQMTSIKFKNLLINFTTEFHSITSTQTSASNPGNLWRPAPAPDVLPGFFPLGDVIASEDGDINGKRVVAVVCEGDLQSGDSAQTKALSPPDDYEQLWRDSNSKQGGAMWRPIAPDGYIALGVVCSRGDEKPPLHAVRCVRADLVISSRVGNSIWNNWDSGAEESFSAYQVEPPVPAAGEIYFAPGTFIGFKKDSQSSILVEAFSLRMEIPLKINPAPTPPVLSGFESPSSLEPSQATQIATIPWFAVKDIALRPIDQFRTSPYYYLNRTDHYVLIGHSHNTGDEESAFKWTAGRVLVSNVLQIFIRETSIQVQTEWTSGTSDAGQPVNFSAKLSESFIHNETSSSGWSNSKTETVEAIVPPNKMVAVYQLQSHYDLLREDGTEAAVNFSYADRGRFHFTEYPPGGNAPLVAPQPPTDSTAITDTAP
jgi:hypothetical protein